MRIRPCWTKWGAKISSTNTANNRKGGSQAQPPWPKPLTDSDQASLEVRRSGPLVALVSGDAIPDESHKLISTVHFETDLTAIPQPTESEVTKTGKLLFGIVTLVLIWSGEKPVAAGSAELQRRLISFLGDGLRLNNRQAKRGADRCTAQDDRIALL